MVLRAYNTGDSPVHAVINLPRWNRSIEADFIPDEIKTLYIPQNASQPVRETDLLEWE